MQNSQNSKRGLWLLLAACGTGVLLVIYVVAMLYRAFVLLHTGGLVPSLLALGLLIFSLVVVWSLYREFKFGLAASRLTKQLAAREQLYLPVTQLPDSTLTPREQAKSVVIKAQEAAAANPHSWEDHIRLAVVLRAAGEHGAARKAARQAIALWRAE